MKRGLVLTGVLLATFLAAIEGTVIGPAGPTIVSELDFYSIFVDDGCNYAYFRQA